MTTRALAALVALLFALPVVASWHGSVPGALRMLSAAILVLSAVRPAWGLLAVAALVPVASPLDLLAGAPFGAPGMIHLLLAPLLFAAAARTAVTGRPLVSRLFAPAVVMAAIVASAAAVQLSVEQQATAFGDTFGAGLWRHLTDTYFVRPRVFTPLQDAMLWIDALGLAVLAEHVLRTRPDARAGVLRMAAAGITAAAAMSGFRVIEVSIRSPAPLETAWNLLRSVRFSPLVADLNAAGSLYAMYFVPVVAWISTRRHAMLWPAAVVIGLALWATGSRTALAAAVIGLGCAWMAIARPPRGRLVFAGAGVLALAWIVTLNPGRHQADAATALRIRAGMTRIGLTLATEAPVFGLGFGGFAAASSVEAPASLVETFPELARGENAHNNFVQILVELGAVGLLALLWLLAAAAGGLVARLRTAALGRIEAGLGAGLLAFVITMLGGHPLLVPQVLVPFGLVLGLTAGAAASRPPGTARGPREEPGPVGPPRAASRLRAGAAAAAAVAVLVSVPFRAGAARAGAAIDGVVIGAVDRAPAGDGPRAWIVERRARWFVSRDVRVLTFTLRQVDAPSASCRVTVEVDDGPVETDRQVTSEPLRVRVDVSAAESGAATRRLDVRVTAGACAVVVEDFDARRGS